MDIGLTKEEKETRELFVFEVDEELFAVTATEVDQVLRVPPITTVPGAPLGIVGIFHLRGRVIVTLDLEQRLGLTREKPFTPSYLFITHIKNNYYAALIDRPHAVLRVPVVEITAPPKLPNTRVTRKFVEGVFVRPLPLKPVFVLTLSQVLNEEELGETTPMLTST